MDSLGTMMVVVKKMKWKLHYSPSSIKANAVSVENMGTQAMSAETKMQTTKPMELMHIQRDTTKT